MAYGNWGAFVRKDGIRMTEWEDATPYRETELPSGYQQAFLRNSEFKTNPHHAVLGEKDVRLCGYKNYPALFKNGEEVELDEYMVNEGEEWGDNEYAGEIDGYKFTVKQYNGDMVELKLIEPDGTVWESTCGYAYGAGYMD